MLVTQLHGRDSAIYRSAATTDDLPLLQYGRTRYGDETDITRIHEKT